MPTNKHTAGSEKANPGVTRRRAVKIVAITGGCAAAIGVGGYATVARAKGYIQDVKEAGSALATTVKGMLPAVKKLDFATVGTMSDELAGQLAHLRELLDSPLAKVAGITPYKTDLEAGRKLVNLLDGFNNETVKPLVSFFDAHSIKELVRYDGDTVFVDIATLREMATLARTALASVEQVGQQVGAMDGDYKIAQLSSAIKLANETLSDFDFNTLGKALDLVDRVPTILGEDGGEHWYLIVAQANCEVRSCGGFPGAVGFMCAQGGFVRLSGFDSISTYMPWMKNYPLYINDEEWLVFGDKLSYIPGDMNKDPDFPRVADLWSQALLASSGLSIEGVIATDPVFVQALLGLTNTSVAMDDGSVLDGTNTAEVLLNSVYWWYLTRNYRGSVSDEATNAYFYDFATRALPAVVGALPSVSPTKLVDTLLEAFHTRRLNFWFRDEAAQAALEGMGLTNGLCHDPNTPTLGFFITNDTWAKIDWYLDRLVWVSDPYEEDGSQVYQVDIALSSFLTWDEVYAAEAASGGWIVGGNNEIYARCTGDMVTDYYLYAPAGGYIRNLWSSGTASGLTPTVYIREHSWLQVVNGTFQLLPGETVDFHFEVVCAPGATEKLALDLTPLCR